MFLTGYDSKWLNTIYVDKNLRYHGWVQTYSRTNRILGSEKSQGNVVCYRNLKYSTDEAVALFADKDAKEIITLEPYEHHLNNCIEAIVELRKITPTTDSVNELAREEDKYQFITAFRNLLRILNVLSTFTQFSFDQLDLDEQTFEDYKSKYLDLHDRMKSDRQKEKISILDSIDFEVELIHRDEINVSYILDLIIKMRCAKSEETERYRQSIMNAIESEPQLRSKKELIRRFIREHVPRNTQ